MPRSNNLCIVMMSVNVSLVLMVCYLPNICTLFIIAFTSRPSTSIKHLQFYTLTLVFLNSSLNPVIYCWKMKHIRHTIIGLIRNAFTKQNYTELQNNPSGNNIRYEKQQQQQQQTTNNNKCKIMLC